MKEETNTQPNKKKYILIGIILFLVILGAGGALITKGIFVTEETKVEEQSKTNEDNIAELEKEKEELLPQESKLKASVNEEFKKNGFTEEYYNLDNQRKKISDRITEIEFEISKIKNGYYDNKASIDEGVKKGIPFIFPGIAFVIGSFVVMFMFIKKAGSISPMSISLDNPLGSNHKEMLEDLSDIAVKMAREMNPTYEEFKCPNCGASLDPEHTETKTCQYCKTELYRTMKKTKK